MSRHLCCSLLSAGMLLAIFAQGATATTTSVATYGNKLAGATTAASTEINPSFFPVAHAVDNLVRAVPPTDQDHGLIFSNGDSDQRLGLTGSFGKLQELRIWTIFAPSDNRIPNNVTVRSSTTALSGAALITAANYETSLGFFSLGAGAFTGLWPNTDSRYATVLIDAPAGTQSLYLAFGNVGDGKGERISEVQAFVPEPGTMILAAAGILGLVGCARRRR